MPSRTEFWSLVYGSRQYLRLLHAFLLFMLLLTGVSFLLGDSGTGSRVLAYVNLILIIVVGTVAYGLYWYAARQVAAS